MRCMHHRTCGRRSGPPPRSPWPSPSPRPRRSSTAPAAAAADFPSYDSRYHTYAEMVAEIKAAQAAHPDIVAAPLDRQELPGPGPLGGQGLGQRRDRRARARGPVRLAPPRPRAPVARADPGDPALADHGLRHGRADHDDRQHPRDLDRVRGQPRRRRVRPDRLAVPRLAQEPPAERRARPRSAPTSTATTATTGRAAAARRLEAVVQTYHGPSAFSAPETRAIRDFMASRRIGGRQQIKTAITFHTAGEQILWPYGYTEDRRAVRT